MHSRFLAVPLLVFGGALASAQVTALPSAGRVFTFTQATTPQAYQDISIALRNIADASEYLVNNYARTMSVKVPPAEMGMAEWLFNELDKPSGTQPAGSREFTMPGADDVVKIFYLVHGDNKSLGEMSGLVRTVAEVSRLLINPATGALIMRGPAARISLGAWIIQQLDDGAPSSTPLREFVVPGNSGEVIQILAPAHSESLTEIVTAIRTITDTQRVFPVTTAKAFLTRDKADRLALADWLFQELDQAPVSSNQDPLPPAREYRPQGGPDDVVNVFHVVHAPSPQRLTEIADSLRTASGVSRVGTCTASRTVVLRGSAAQMELAARSLKDVDR